MNILSFKVHLISILEDYSCDPMSLDGWKCECFGGVNVVESSKNESLRVDLCKVWRIPRNLSISSVFLICIFNLGLPFCWSLG